MMDLLDVLKNAGENDNPKVNTFTKKSNTYGAIRSVWLY